MQTILSSSSTTPSHPLPLKTSLFPLQVHLILFLYMFLSFSASPCHPLQAHLLTTIPCHPQQAHVILYKPMSSSSSISSCGMLQVRAILYKPILSLQALVIPYKPNSSLQISMPSSPSPPHHYKPRSSPQAHLITTSPGHHHKPISSLQAQVITTSPSLHYKPRSSSTYPFHSHPEQSTSSSTNPSHPRPLQADLVFCKPTSSSSSTSPDHKLMAFSFPTSPCHPLLQQSCLTPYAHIIISLCKPVSCFNFRCWPISSAHVSLLLCEPISLFYDIFGPYKPISKANDTFSMRAHFLNPCCPSDQQVHFIST